MAVDTSLIAELRDIKDRLRRVENGIPLQNASVTRGRLRFIGGLLLIDNGGRLEVNGSASINGTLTIDGTFLLTGSGWRIIGSGSIEGPTTVTGTLQIDGDTRITGNLSLEGDINLSGRIAAGDMVIDPDDEGGSILFGDGAKVTANDGAAGVKIASGSGWAAYVASNGIRLAGDVGEASITLLPALLTIGAERVQIAADELVLAAPTADLADVTYILARTSSGEARWIPVDQITG